jgi:ABC-type amino acid transport substrate-binding protein
MHKTTMAPNTIVHQHAPSPDGSENLRGPGTLVKIRERGSIRIGYDPNNLPMSFINSQDDLVGFDVELSEKMAQALNVRAEFVPIRWKDVPEMLADGDIDVMPGVWYRPFWFSSVQLSEPYFVATVGIATKDERRHEFDTMEELQNAKGLKIGVPLDTRQIEYTMQRYFGDADVEFVTIDFWPPYFEGKHPEIDAFLMPVEHAVGWTLLHPQYSVVVPQPNPVRIPTAFAVAPGSEELTDVINEWVIYAENAGIIQTAYDYWIMAKGAQVDTPRWSIIRDVLGWVE